MTDTATEMKRPSYTEEKDFEDIPSESEDEYMPPKEKNSNTPNSSNDDDFYWYENVVLID